MLFQGLLLIFWFDCQIITINETLCCWRSMSAFSDKKKKKSHLDCTPHSSGINIPEKLVGLEELKNTIFFSSEFQNQMWEQGSWNNSRLDWENLETNDSTLRLICLQFSLNSENLPQRNKRTVSDVDLLSSTFLHLLNVLRNVLAASAFNMNFTVMLTIFLLNFISENVTDSFLGFAARTLFSLYSSDCLGGENVKVQ